MEKRYLLLLNLIIEFLYENLPSLRYSEIAIFFVSKNAIESSFILIKEV